MIMTHHPFLCLHLKKAIKSSKSSPKKNPTVLRRRCPPPPSSVFATAMWYPSKGVIHLEDDSAGDESVDSDVEEVVQWDRSLRNTKMFKKSVLILSGRKFESPTFESLQKILHLYINEPTLDYFKKNHCKQLPLRTFRPLARLGGSRR
jgi:hypothetical protein